MYIISEADQDFSYFQNANIIQIMVNIIYEKIHALMSICDLIASIPYPS